ncbi:MAG TPA: hypothetical protein VF418_11355 [Sphingomonadaceae bacterium]
MDDQALDRISKDVEFLKKVMVIDLVSRGLSQDEVGSLMGVKQSTISEMFPKGILKKAKQLNKSK